MNYAKRVRKKRFLKNEQTVSYTYLNPNGVYLLGTWRHKGEEVSFTIRTDGKRIRHPKNKRRCVISRATWLVYTVTLQKNGREYTHHYYFFA